MALFLCKTHGPQPPSGTSDRLAAALERGEHVPADWVSLVIVKSGDRASWHLVDSERVMAAGLDPASSPFVLHDRDHRLRVLNDRLLIVKIVPSDLKVPMVCKRCLAAAVMHQGTERLRWPKDLVEEIAVNDRP